MRCDVGRHEAVLDLALIGDRTWTRSLGIRSKVARLVESPYDHLAQHATCLDLRLLA